MRYCFSEAWRDELLLGSDGRARVLFYSIKAEPDEGRSGIYLTRDLCKVMKEHCTRE